MTTPFERAFREELLQVARRDERRRRYTVRGAIAVALATVAGVVAIVLPGDPVAADVHVTLRNDVLEVELTDSTSSPADVLAALHEHGLEAVVASVPTGPSSVGRFLRVEFEEQDASPVNVTYLEPSGSAYLAFRVPADWPGQMIISLGRAAERGEAYDGPTDAFLPGEPLHCSGVGGSPLAASVDALADLIVRVEVDDGPERGRQLTLGEAMATDYRGWYVTRAFAVSATSVILEVSSTAPGEGDRSGC